MLLELPVRHNELQSYVLVTKGSLIVELHVKHAQLVRSKAHQMPHNVSHQYVMVPTKSLLQLIASAVENARLATLIQFQMLPELPVLVLLY
jgi:hypothetical protein